MECVSNHFVLQALCHPLLRLWDWVFSICKFKNFLTVFKIFWPHSIFLECVQIFLTMLKHANSYLRYNLTFDHGQNILTVFKNYWTWSKNFEPSWSIFELGDGIDLSLFTFQFCLTWSILFLFLFFVLQENATRILNLHAHQRSLSFPAFL